jgi:hypothetical protein
MLVAYFLVALLLIFPPKYGHFSLKELVLLKKPVFYIPAGFSKPWEKITDSIYSV